jgi:L-threonylcarbamoyladenylate synthase
MTALTLDTTKDGLAQAAAILAEGGLVAFPTETVYGLGADATNDRAVARIFAAKGRPRFNPLICHVPDVEAVTEIATLSDAATALADRFWPGPLTLVLPRRGDGGLSRLVSAGLPTVAIRVPAAATAVDLLRRFGRPVAAPSANRSGRLSPTTAQHVLADLGAAIDAVVDGGACDIGVESTIIGFADGRPTVLRPGGLSVEAIEAVIGSVARPEGSGDPSAVVAPGMLASHYAPRLPLRTNAARARAGEVLLGFGPAAPPGTNLSPTGDLIEAAANLFAMLHRLDQGGATSIAVMAVPDHGLGRAINDRLRRAAAPREPC